MATQSELIGNHPKPKNEFDTWFTCNDIKVTATKCHRSLVTKKGMPDDELVEWLAKRLIHHHHDENRIKKLKEKYGKVGFAKYAKERLNLPSVDVTMKGNLAEVILIEYLESCHDKPLLKVYKFRYNPNVDHAMHGDDVLLANLIPATKKEKAALKLLLGEAKFRKTPKKADVEAIAGSLTKDKKPLSYTFLVDQLSSKKETKDLADLLDDFIVEEIKQKGDIVYPGFLLSNESTFDVVESHLSSRNKNLVFISAGIKDPEILIKKAFKKANEMLLAPLTI